MTSFEPHKQVDNGAAPRAGENAAAPVRRAVQLALVLVLLEALALGIARMSPATAGLMRPVYIILIVAFAIPIWHASRRRTGQDRRHGDRREDQ